MSKSDPSDQSRITLTDDADAIAKKVRKAKTDPDALPTSKDGFDGRPEAANLMGIYAALSGQDLAQVIRDHGGHQFSQFKQDLADLMVDKLQPITAEMRRLTDDPGYIDGVLKRGAEKARALSEPIMAEVHDIVGFLRP
tara:strand:- start:569 stop:985 length:417 start_codon:yes stop_codon:yes gene_type:complete